MSFLRTGFHELMRWIKRGRLGRALRQERERLAALEEDLGIEAWKFFAARPARAEPALEPMLAPLRALEAEATGPRRDLAEAERELEAEQAARAAAEKKATAELATLTAERAPVERELRALSPARALAPVALPAAGTEAAADPPAPAPPAAEEPGNRLAARLTELDQRIASRREEQRRADEGLAARVTAAQKKVTTLQHKVAELAAARSGPLRALGRQVADDVARAPEAPAVRERLDLVRSRRERIGRLEGRRGVLAAESRAADPQDLRLSVFAAATLAVILGLALLIFFRAPEERDWLPADTRALLSTNLSRLAAVGAAQPESPWRPLWDAAVRPLAALPEAETGRQVSRVLLALGGGVEYRVAQTSGLAVGLIARWEGDKQIVPTDSTQPLALTVWRRSTGTALPGSEGAQLVACAQIGPRTIAFGSPEQVRTLVKVRLGLEPDLRTDEDFYSKFERLERGAGFRLVTREPGLLHAGMDPLFAPELIAGCVTLGLAVEAVASTPVSMRLSLRYQTEAAAREAAARLRSHPAAMLRLEGAEAEASAGGAEIDVKGTVVEARLRLGGAAARDFLARLAAAHGGGG